MRWMPASRRWPVGSAAPSSDRGGRSAGRTATNVPAAIRRPARSFGNRASSSLRSDRDGQLVGPGGPVRRRRGSGDLDRERGAARGGGGTRDRPPRRQRQPAGQPLPANPPCPVVETQIDIRPRDDRRKDTCALWCVEARGTVVAPQPQKRQSVRLRPRPLLPSQPKAIVDGSVLNELVRLMVPVPRSGDTGAPRRGQALLERPACRSTGKPDSGRRDSNPRPFAWEANALPAELLPHGLRTAPTGCTPVATGRSSYPIPEYP